MVYVSVFFTNRIDTTDSRFFPPVLPHSSLPALLSKGTGQINSQTQPNYFLPISLSKHHWCPTIKQNRVFEKKKIKKNKQIKILHFI